VKNRSVFDKKKCFFKSNVADTNWSFMAVIFTQKAILHLLAEHSILIIETYGSSEDFVVSNRSRSDIMIQLKDDSKL
jgi:hypothetical protein